MTQARQGFIEHSHLGSHAHADAGGVIACNAATNHGDPGGGNARHTAKQHPDPTGRLLQREGSHLDRHAAGHLAHRLEQGEAAIGVGHGFIGDADDAGGDEVAGLLGVRREVEIGEQHLAGAQHGALGRLRFLDLDHHIGRSEHRRRVWGDAGAGREIILVGRADAATGIGLDQHGVAGMGEFGDALGGETDAVFVVLDLFGNADQHRMTLLRVWGEWITAAAKCRCKAGGISANVRT